MQVLYPRCCGLDMQQKTVVACVLVSDAAGTVQRFVRTFGTMAPSWWRWARGWHSTG
jgi:hypothetical protein